jgi:hypothetical protein
MQLAQGGALAGHQVLGLYTPGRHRIRLQRHSVNEHTQDRVHRY